jgi:hypothetical protein
MKGQRRVTSGIPERAILLTCLVLAMGCADERGNGPESIDSVQFKLDFGGGVTLNSVNYTLTGPNNFMKTGTLSVGSSDTVSAMFGALPSGKGYDVKVQGTASDGSSFCTGEAMFNVPLPSPFVSIPLMCSGFASVSADVNVCPTIDSLSVVPAEAYVGGSMQLALAAHDADNGPSPLTASWSSSPSGTLSNLSTMGATFTCTAAGTFNIAVSVSDGSAAMNCADSASVDVVCTPLPGGM